MLVREWRKLFKDPWLLASPINVLMVRLFLFVSIYWVLFMYYFGLTFSFYGIPHLANFSELNLFILPFLLSATILGVFLGLILPRRELATLLVLLSSMPLIFASGFVLPTSAVPESLLWVLGVIPVIPAMSCFLRLNQMGADFMDIIHYWNQLWYCALGYGLLSWLILRTKRKLQGTTSSPLDS